ncbi:helicase associated domain-containing protein [Streptomyces nodosus]|uniref:helicase associated domain-containing protein n=1 Tax=Streptomyces nodosus TaxID=40318 RepID=UPI0036E28ED3
MLRAHLATGADPAALTRDILLAGVKVGSWLHRQLTTWPALHPGQQQLMTALGLTPDSNPLTPVRRARRTFEETVQLLELFLHREGRIPAARETVRVDGDTVKLGAWLAKARTKHRSGQLPDEHVRLVAALFEGDWTAEDAVPAVLM